MTHYLVISPEYGTVIPILDYGEGPMEYGRDVVCVDAATKRQAKVLGVRKMRNDAHCHYHADHCDTNPFTGVAVEPAECAHGKRCYCGCEECPECEAETAPTTLSRVSAST